MTFQYKLSEIDAIAQQIIPLLQHKVVLLEGAMGMGKTTLVKALVKALGISDVVASPTFSLVNEYVGELGQKVYHFDFYRIENQQEALDFGVEEYIYSGHWCFMEWSEKIPELLPEVFTKIEITLIDADTRQIEIR